MNTTTASKTDFIKFNVSPTFKLLAEEKARKHGLTLSELGRMLFGAFVTDMATPHMSMSPTFLASVNQAKKDHASKKGTLVTTKDELEAFLKTL